MFFKPRLIGFSGLICGVFMALLTPSSEALARTHHHAHHPARAAAAAAPASRYAAVIIDDETGRVLTSTNPDRRSFPASLTKMMTLYLLFDALDQGRLTLRSQLPVSVNATLQAPSKLALEAGDRIAVEDAILALVTKSANDVAVVVAESLGGTESQFAQHMTAKAQALGMSETVYRNASGLPNPGQITTPRDQATLAHALIHNHARFYHYFSAHEFAWQGQVIPSHNRFMLNYDGADGIKTGYINASGFNLVASAVRDGHRLIGAVFGGNTAQWRDRRMAQLFDVGYARLGVGTADMAAIDDEPATPPAPPTKPEGKRAKSKGEKPVQTAEGDDDASAWAIQVGAFALYKPAHHAATSAARTLGGLIAKASIEIDSGQNTKRSLYRARLIGFSATQAQAACKKLARAKRECHVIQPES